MSLLLGIDLGTSYFKVGLFDEAGSIRGLGRVAVDKVTPAAGWFEQSVEDFWRLLRQGLGEALAEAGAKASDISGLSYSSQATTFVLLDRQKQALTPLVFWTDMRAEPVPQDLLDFSKTETFRRTVGFGGISAFSAVAKLNWFQRQQPEIWKRTAHIMTISDYFTFALTGERVGDASTAALLALYDLPKRSWWPEALAKYGLEAAQLSTPLRPGSVGGQTTTQATALLGLPVGIPLAVGGLDHHVAAIGSGLERFADMSISTGTVLAALALVDNTQPTPDCYHGLHVDGTRYYRLSFDPNGAGQLENYQKQYAPKRSIEELLEFAAKIPPRTQPVNPPSINATDAEHGIAVRNLLEKISYTHRTLVEKVAGVGKVRKIVATGGGARSPLWLQIKADILGVPMVTPACQERACLGAAAFAAVAAGRHATIPAALQAMVHPDRTFEPDEKRVALYRKG